MKNQIFISLFVLMTIFTTNISAQHPDLQQGRWYVQQITINGETTEIPDDPVDFPFTYLNFFSGTSGLVGSENTPAINFYGIDCQIGFVGHVSFTSTDVFDFTDFTPFSLTSECNEALSGFMSIYLDFFQENHSETFTYSITTNPDESKTLRVVNNAGDEAIYTNTFLIPPPTELTGNTWFLQNMVINGTDNLPPNNEEFSAIIYNFHINQDNTAFKTCVCDGIFGNQHFDITQSSFYLYEITVGLIQCGIPENNDYQNMYFDFFLNSLPGPHNYTLEENGSVKTLTITNSLGDYTVYSNIVSSIESNESNNFKIYPNPTKDKLIIETSKENVESISLYDITGKKIIDSDKNILNVSGLINGVYFIRINTIENQNIIKKIIID